MPCMYGMGRSLYEQEGFYLKRVAMASINDSWQSPFIFKPRVLTLLTIHGRVLISFKHESLPY